MISTVKNRDYAHSEKKYNARRDCIVNPYRLHFGLENIPSDRQYWTLCNVCAENGKVKTGSEFDYIVNEVGLCRENQFYGVEIDEDIASENSKLSVGNWINGDLCSVMDEYASRDNFNPAIINIDTGFMPKRASKILSEVLFMVSQFELNNVYVLLNYVLSCRTKRGVVKTILEELKDNNRACRALTESDWVVSSSQYAYQGTSEKSRTEMSSIAFILKD